MHTGEKKIKILVVDDERKACSILRNILVKYIGINTDQISEAYNTREAESQIREHPFDVVFLDIEMPNENAFQFLSRIAPLNFEVIFVTAFDEYAVKAFRLNAVDYILKPISIGDLKNAVQRLQERLKYRSAVKENKPSYQDLSVQLENKVKQEKIVLRDKSDTEVISFKDILYVEADGSYSRIKFMKGDLEKEITMSWLLTDYEELLPANQFFRIHRSYLVNCSHVMRIVNDDTNYVVLGNHSRLMVSRRNYMPFLNFLKINNFRYE